jgi:hypothetical protein
VFWNNIVRDCRFSVSNPLLINGTSGTSINNLWENVYFDSSAVALALSVQLIAAPTQNFHKCNFGGSLTEGQFVVTASSCYGLQFTGCNFETQRVAAAGAAFSLVSRGKVVFDSCTFNDIDENGAGAAMIRGIVNTTLVDIRNCEVVNGNSAITYYIDAQAATFTVYNAPQFADRTKHRYAQSGGIQPPVIRNVAEQDAELRSLTFRRIDGTNRAVSVQDIFTTYSSAGAIHDLLSFTHGAPTATDDSTVVAGELTIEFAGRSDAGVRVNGHARFDVYYNNDGAATITRSIMQSVGTRTVDIAVTQSGAVFRLTVTPSAGAISGGRVTASFRHLNTQNTVTPIATAFVP